MSDKQAAALRKSEECLAILRAIGFPLNGRSAKMQLRLARILLAVCDVRPATAWAEAKVWPGESSYSVRSRAIIKFINQHYSEKIADSSYDDIRRKNLDYLVEAGLVLRSPGKPDASTNDGTRAYAANPSAERLLRGFGKPGWKESVEEFVKNHGRLAALLERPRKQDKLVVKLPDGVEIQLAKGAHNDLQKAIVDEFMVRFIKNPELLYIGDAAQKEIYKNRDRLLEIKFFELAHDRLPDVVILDRERQWLFLIEAVHSSNPVSKLRHRQLEQAAAQCTVGIVYVSAFKNRKDFKKWILEIGWETEVWLLESPEHLIHFNGDRFLGPHNDKQPKIG